MNIRSYKNLDYFYQKISGDLKIVVEENYSDKIKEELKKISIIYFKTRVEN
jgi:hypothetical protein